VKEENKRTVWQGINNLTSEIRMAIILRDIQGKQYEEIAEIMSLPLGTVKSRINRGRLQLAKILKEKKERRNEM
jgi:RNA polymerase sigma-70 factor (ECF subfamily)